MRKLVEDERRRPGITCTSENRVAVWTLNKKRTVGELRAILDDIGYECWRDERDTVRGVGTVTDKYPSAFDSMTYSIRTDNLLVPIEVVYQARQLLRAVFTFVSKGTRLRYEPPTARVVQHGHKNSDSFSFYYHLICEEQK